MRLLAAGGLRQEVREHRTQGGPHGRRMRKRAHLRQHGRECRGEPRRRRNRGHLGQGRWMRQCARKCHGTCAAIETRRRARTGSTIGKLDRLHGWLGRGRCSGCRRSCRRNRRLRGGRRNRRRPQRGGSRRRQRRRCLIRLVAPEGGDRRHDGEGNGCYDQSLEHGPQSNVLGHAGSGGNALWAKPRTQALSCRGA